MMLRSVNLHAPSSSGVVQSSSRLNRIALSRPKPLTKGRGPEPARLTYNQNEVYAALGMDREDNMVEDSNYQVFDPELGRLEGRGFKYELDACMDDEIDMKHTEYWFHTPEEGWRSDPVKTKAAEEVEVTEPNPGPHEEEGGERAEMEKLEEYMEEGQLLYGTVTDIWLYHGVQVDFGAKFDGLIPITQDQWTAVGSEIMPEDEVLIRIHKLRLPGLYRWPVQLELINHTASEIIMLPDDYIPTINHDWCGEQGMSIEDICKATGRTFEEVTYFEPESDTDYVNGIQELFGHDDPQTIADNANMEEDPEVEEARIRSLQRNWPNILAKTNARKG